MKKIFCAVTFTAFLFCFLGKTKQAIIAIFDLNGKMINQYNLQQGKEQQLTIEANTLQPGMYIYTLIADGVEVISKKMILTK